MQLQIFENKNQYIQEMILDEIECVTGAKTNWGSVMTDSLNGALEGGTTGAVSGAVGGWFFGGPGGSAAGFFGGAAGGALGGLVYGGLHSYMKQNYMKQN